MRGTGHGSRSAKTRPGLVRSDTHTLKNKEGLSPRYVVFAVATQSSVSCRVTATQAGADTVHCCRSQAAMAGRFGGDVRLHAHKITPYTTQMGRFWGFPIEFWREISLFFGQKLVYCADIVC